MFDTNPQILVFARTFQTNPLNNLTALSNKDNFIHKNGENLSDFKKINPLFLVFLGFWVLCSGLCIHTDQSLRNLYLEHIWSIFSSVPSHDFLIMVIMGNFSWRKRLKTRCITDLNCVILERPETFSSYCMVIPGWVIKSSYRYIFNFLILNTHGTMSRLISEVFFIITSKFHLSMTLLNHLNWGSCGA